MRYHDFHLSSYLVSDFGTRIVLNLVYDYPGQTREESHIEFTDVACYHFVHSGGAIITDIDEEPLDAFVKKEEAFLSATYVAQSVRFWQKSASDYLVHLQNENYRAWRIGSAIGFAGFVVAKKVGQISEPNKALLPTTMAVTICADAQLAPATVAADL